MFIPFQLLLSELSKSYQPAFKTKQLHALVAKTHLSLDPFFATRLVRLYALSNDLSSARNLFDEMTSRSIYLWNSMIRAYARAHDFLSTFSLFNEMLWSEVMPDSFTFACVIRASCENNDLGGLRVVHSGALRIGLATDAICCSALVSAYPKLGLVDEAEKVFRGVDDPDLPMWNSMISGYACSGFWEKGMRLFSDMRHLGRKSDGYTMVGLLLGLGDPQLLGFGQGLHGFCVRNGFHENPHVVSSLVSMYTRCSCLHSAYKAFACLSEPDLVTCSSLMTGFSQFGEYRSSLMLFKEMNMYGLKGDPVVILNALSACGQLAILSLGCEVHGYILRHGLESDVMVASALVDMYFRCGFADLAKITFQSLPRKNTVTYNTTILGLGSCGLPFEAFNIFNELLDGKITPDQSTLSALLHVCCQSGLVKDGKEYFRRLRDEYNIEPTTEHYVNMVKLLGMSGELVEAYNLIMNLPEPIEEEGIWGALLACCEAQGDTRMAEMVAQNIFKTDPANSSYMVNPANSSYMVKLSNIYAMDGRWDDVKKLRDEIDDSGQRKFPGLSWTT